MTYAYHPSGLARLYIWRPTDAGGSPVSFTNKPAMLFVHGGLWHNPGDDACRPPRMNTIANNLATLFASTTYGWPIISIEHPQSPSNFDQLRDIPSVAQWPEPEMYVAWAISFLKDNYTGAKRPSAEYLRSGGSSGSQVKLTKYGEQLWGAGNSINPDALIGFGNSSGAATLLFNQLTPDGLYPRFEGPIAMTNDDKYPRSSHKLAGVIGTSCPCLWDTFHMDPAIGSGDVYGDEKHQHFQRKDSNRTWPEVSLEVKKAASVYHILNQGYEENKSRPFYLYNTQVTDGKGDQILKASYTGANGGDGFLFDSITGLTEMSGAGGAHHHFHAAMVKDLLDAGKGDPRSVARWGDSTATYGNPDATNRADLTDQELQDSIEAWITGTGSSSLGIS